MKKSTKQIPNLLARYIIIFLVGLGNLYIFYKILTPLTINTLAIIIRLFTTATIISNTITLPSITIELIPACIAASAYYLLFILNLSTPAIQFKNRAKILLISFLSLFVLNIVRILILLAVNKTTYFQPLHEFFWYAISTIFVIAIWIFTIKHYKIKQIPVYDDVLYLYKLIKKKQSTNYF